MSTSRTADPRKQLAQMIQATAEARGLNRKAMARICRDAPSQMSRLMTGHYTEFSTERLFHFLLALGHDVRITVSRSFPSAGRGKLTVTRGWQ